MQKRRISSRLCILTFLLLLTVNVFSQSQTLNIKGFGDVTIHKTAENNYTVDMGKYGRFSAAGFLSPLNLTISTTKESLREFPGYALYNKMDLQEVELSIGQEGLAIEASIDTRKNFGEVLDMFQIPSPTMEVSVALTKTSFELGGGLDFEDDPIVLNLVPDFTRFTLENFNINAEWAAGEDELELTLGVEIQTRWKPTEWDPDIQSVTAFSYNLMSNELSAAISMTDTWTNPILLNKLLKPNSVEFTDVSASLDWPVGAPSPTAFGFIIGHASFFDLDFTAKLAMTPADKQIALYAYRDEVTMNDFSQILRNGFGLQVPDIFPHDIYIKDAEILFSPNGGEVGEFEIEKGFAFRGKAKFMDAIEAEVDFTANFEDGFYLYYDMNAAFKDYFDNQFRDNPKLKYISGQLLTTFEVRRVMLEARADMNMNMSGKTYCDFTILGKAISFSVEGQFSTQALLDKIEQEILNIAGPEVAAVISAVSTGVAEAGKLAGEAVGAGADLAHKYVTLGVTKSQHIHPFDGGEKYCRSHCIPNRANDLAGQVENSSRQAIQTFFNRVLPTIVQIEGETLELTMQMRRELVQAEWDALNQKIEQDWKDIWEDKEYVGYFVEQKWAENGGNQFRALIDERKAKFAGVRDHLFQQLLTAGFTDASLYATIDNRWKGTKINIELGKVSHDEMNVGAHSTRWVFEPIVGTRYVRIKSYWKGTYLNIENGSLACTEIQPAWHSAMWELLPVGDAPGYYLIRNRWKETFIHVEHGAIECSYAEKGWHSAHWKVTHTEVPSEVSVGQDWGLNSLLLVSPNKKYKLFLQQDGNLVLSKYNTIQYWWSNTYGKNVIGARFEHGGNLAIYHANDVVWLSNTDNKGAQKLVLQDDGNLVIYAAGNRALWSSNTIEEQAAVPQKKEFIRIKNAWKGTYLNIEQGLAVNEIAAGAWSSQWILEPCEGFYKIKNRWKGTYLHIEGGMEVQCSEIQPGWHSAMWSVEQIEGSNQVRIKNRWKGTYLNIETGALSCSDIQPGWASAKWELE